MAHTLRWGILSTARINRRLIPAVKQSERSRLLAVASRNLDTAAEFAQKWEIPLALGKYEALLARPDIDVVYIPLPNSMHHEWTVKAARAGKHILCEKPLAMNVIEAEEMIQAAQDNGVVLLEAVVYQLHPQLAKLKAVIQEGLIGRVKLIRAYFSFTLPENATNFRLDKSLGGGSLWDLGSYPVSFANTIAGMPPEEVFAWQQTDPGGVDVMFIGQMRYGNGILAQIDCGFRTTYRVGAEVSGEMGLIRIPEPWQPDTDHKTSGFIHIAADDTETCIPSLVINPYFCQIQAMEGAILDGAPIPYPLHQSRINIATINALHESAEQGKSVRVVP